MLLLVSAFSRGRELSRSFFRFRLELTSFSFDWQDQTERTQRKIYMHCPFFPTSQQRKLDILSASAFPLSLSLSLLSQKSLFSADIRTHTPPSAMKKKKKKKKETRVTGELTLVHVRHSRAVDHRPLLLLLLGLGKTLVFIRGRPKECTAKKSRCIAEKCTTHTHTHIRTRRIEWLFYFCRKQRARDGFGPRQ